MRGNEREKIFYSKIFTLCKTLSNLIKERRSKKQESILKVQYEQNQVVKDFLTFKKVQIKLH